MDNKLLLRLIYSASKSQNFKYTAMLKNKDTFNFSLHLLHSHFLLIPVENQVAKITLMPPAGEWL